MLAASAGAVIADDNNPRVKQQESEGPAISPHETNAVAGAPTKGGTGALTPITKHGGPVMGTPTPYLIWYGNWNQANNSDTPAGQQLVRDFLYGLNASPYYQINTTYGGPSGNVGLAVKETTTPAALHSSLSDSGVLTVVTNAINSKALPKDPYGVYFVITSSDIAKSGFCSSYCGWHTNATIGGTDIKYSFVGNANRCLSSCAAQTTSPNGNAGVDGMLSVLAHELEETNTDPDLNAWYDASGAENADKCAWTFGQNQTLLNGAYYNMSMNNAAGTKRNYLIQRNLSAVDNKCYVNFTTKAQ